MVEGAPSFRPFVDADGIRYTVRIAPCERHGALGVAWRLNAVVFETAAGWVYSAPVYHNITLESLGNADLQELLEQAK